MKFKIRLLAIALTLQLAACTTPPSLYNPKNISLEQLAEVYGEEIFFGSPKFHSSIVLVIDKHGNEVISTNNMKIFHKKVFLSPGEYTIVLRCSDQYMIGFPRVIVNLEKAENYVGYCRRIRKNGSTIGIEGSVLHENQQPPEGI